MAFFRWYWKLTQEFFGHRNHHQEKGLRSFLRSLFLSLKFFSTTFAIVLGAAFLWHYAPEYAKDFVTRTLVEIWTYVIILGRKIWTMLEPVKPFFVWLRGLDWNSIHNKVFAFMLYIVIATGSFALALPFMGAVIKFILIVVQKLFRLETKSRTKAFLITIITIGGSFLTAYYVTTSSISKLAVSFLAKYF